MHLCTWLTKLNIVADKAAAREWVIHVIVMWLSSWWHGPQRRDCCSVSVLCIASGASWTFVTIYCFEENDSLQLVSESHSIRDVNDGMNSYCYLVFRLVCLLMTKCVFCGVIHWLQISWFLVTMSSRLTGWLCTSCLGCVMNDTTTTAAAAAATAAVDIACCLLLVEWDISSKVEDLIMIKHEEKWMFWKTMYSTTRITMWLVVDCSICELIVWSCHVDDVWNGNVLVWFCYPSAFVVFEHNRQQQWVVAVTTCMFDNSVSSSQHQQYWSEICKKTRTTGSCD